MSIPISLLLSPPTLGERRLRALACRRVAVHRRAVLMLPKGERPCGSPAGAGAAFTRSGNRWLPQTTCNAESSGDFLPPSPPAEKATTRPGNPAPAMGPGTARGAEVAAPEGSNAVHANTQELAR